MTVDLTCPECGGERSAGCVVCASSGRRRPTLAEWDTLVGELDELREERMSNVTVGGEHLTWQEAAEHNWERYQREVALSTVLANLDRCEHGRHEGDVCGSCGGPSHGNPHLQPVMGYGLLATPIVMPANPRERRNAHAWYAHAEKGRRNG